MKKVTSCLKGKLQGDLKEVDRLSKQVFFPVRNGKDVVITPIQHTGLTRDFHLKIDRIKQNKKESIPCRVIKVGGANPINAGQLNAELRGRQRHLKSLPPDFKYSRTRSILSRLKKTGSIFSIDQARAIDFGPLKKIFSKKSDNVSIRKEINDEMKKIVSRLLSDAEYLSEYILNNDDFSFDDDSFKKVSKTERKFLDLRSRNYKKLGSNEKRVLVNKLVANISKNETLLSDRYFDEFKEVAETLIDGYR